MLDEKIVLIWDIDGTCLTQGSPENKYQDSKPKPQMVELVNKLYDSGKYEIQFFTARHFKFYRFTKLQLDDAGFKYHGLTMGKPSGAIYIDDRGFHWTDDKADELLDRIKDL